MNDVDNKACEIAYQATCKHNGEQDWVTYMLGWQAALDYARGQQEPVACIGTNGELMWLNKPDALYSKAVPLYTHPAQPVSEEKRLEAAGKMANTLGVKTTDAYRIIAAYTTPPAQPIQPAAQQEPVAWLDDYEACKCPDNPSRCFSDRVYRTLQKHTHPAQQVQPAVSCPSDVCEFEIQNEALRKVNEQLLEALKDLHAWVYRNVEWGCVPREIIKATATIAAAEAVKGSV